jgi:hypothetical protein
LTFFLGGVPPDEVLKIMPVQKQTQAGKHIRFRAFVAIGATTVTLVWVLSIPRR